VLLELIRRRGALAAKEDLMRAVWQDAVIEDGNLNQMVFLLRRALGEGYIETVPRRGYRFTSAVRTCELPLRIDSVAVLPLANLGDGPAQERTLARGCGPLIRSDRRSRTHPVLLQKIYEGTHLRQKQAGARS
jgi:Transcriptional regulatory protein, C terminal